MRSTAWYSNGGATESDTRGPASGTRRVFRGGAWGWSAFLARTAVRSYYSPSDAYTYLGFRCVRGL
jgi:formylglycine-generating enzyme required for sulfatase activity